MIRKIKLNNWIELFCNHWQISFSLQNAEYENMKSALLKLVVSFRLSYNMHAYMIYGL
jgi:hypothetical protein